MFKSARKCQFSLVLLFLVVMLVQTPRAYTAESTAEKKLSDFVSEVVRLNMTEYKITGVGYGFYFPSEYGGVVKEESISFKLVSNRGATYTVCTDAIFLDGFIYSLFVDEPTDAPMFFVDPQTNALDESRNILQRYKIFAEKYGFDASHIDQALTLLSNVTVASSAHGDSSLLNGITGFIPSVTRASNMKQETEQDSITWIYTEGGVDIPQKCLRIDFGASQLHFVDAWNLFTIGCFSDISEDEAIRIGWDAAKNYNLTFVGEEGSYCPEFEWSNRAYVKLDLVPGQILNVSAADPSINLGNAPRNPLALYPLWFMVFYFKTPIYTGPGRGDIAGIAVNLWGDTKEIISTSITSSFWDATRENPYANTESSSTQTENTTPSPEPNPTPEPFPATLVVVASISCVAGISAGLLFYFKKRKG